MPVVLASSSGIAAVAGLILAAASVAQLADLMVLADLIRLSQKLGDLRSFEGLPGWHWTRDSVAVRVANLVSRLQVDLHLF